MMFIFCNYNLLKTEDNLYQTISQPTMPYEPKWWCIGKKDDNRLHVAEMGMLGWIRGKTRKEYVRNQDTQEDANVTM